MRFVRSCVAGLVIGLVLVLGATGCRKAPTPDETSGASPSRSSSPASPASGLGALEPGQPSAGLLEAVKTVDLRDPKRAPRLAARLRELSASFTEPRALAVMHRALAQSDKAEAAAIGCEILGRAPLEPAAGSEADMAGRESLVEASLLAVANAKAACPHVASYLGKDPCRPFFRCNAQGPLTGREPSLQDEPVCTQAALDDAVKKELARADADVLAGDSGSRPALFAFASLLAQDKVPEPFTKAHVRRRYALMQPKSPSCENGGIEPGTPCHCEEATIRDQTCRHVDPGAIRVGLCRFFVDDAKKTLSGVTASLAP
ncbi:hypothetical protein [Labilithrix luteola]|uniref:hypothetical protein n=1 Tax=Labilithrix luteola TaxID=1391654 RepID=UPI0014728D95|nr:hypothetical protein [Labilithrix luteola]